jgi:hypothetical protein
MSGHTLIAGAVMPLLAAKRSPWGLNPAIASAPTCANQTVYPVCGAGAMVLRIRRGTFGNQPSAANRC